jgi:hypothetical protein
VNTLIRSIQHKECARTTTPAPSGLLQRKCACGQHPSTGGECEECKKKHVTLQRRRNGFAEQNSAPPIVNEVLRSPGQPLDQATRAFMEPRFGHDFSQVRVHTDAQAAESARAVDALAYTVGQNLVFGTGKYAPWTTNGRGLLAHELTHTIQQGREGRNRESAMTTISPFLSQQGEDEAQRSEAELRDGSGTTSSVAGGTVLPSLQRQAHGTPSPVSVRSPVLEEAVTQVSAAEAKLTGRHLTSAEAELAASVFGNSIDYSRVRLIPTDILEFRTVANTIRIPKHFAIADPLQAQTFVHEMTHVWQYQHGGTSYISVSLATQISGVLRTGNRNAAYCYKLTPGKSFFEHMPEQQAMIVENYYKMVRDRSSSDKSGLFLDNYGWVCSAKAAYISWNDRQAEISQELPLHEPLIRQMRAALPRSEADILTLRATEVMQTPGEKALPASDERKLAPVKPLLELRF